MDFVQLYERVNILKLVCQYVSGTQRFKNDDKDSIYNMYEMESKDKISKNMEDMKEMVEKIMVDYQDEYHDDMTIEEREFKSRMDFYLGNDDVDDDDYVNTKDFWNFLDNF